MSSKRKTLYKGRKGVKVKPLSMKQAIALAQAAGASEIEYNGVRVVFPKPTTIDLKANIKQTASSTPATSSAKAEDLISPESIWDQYTDEEVLMWSTVHYDEMQAKKDAQMKKEQENE